MEPIAVIIATVSTITCFASVIPTNDVVGQLSTRAYFNYGMCDIRIL